MPRSERPIKVDIRDIPPETPIEYVKECLINEYNFEIEKGAQVKQFKTKRPLPIYQITLKNKAKNKGIWKINNLMLLKISVKKFERKTGSIQCFKCNLWHRSTAGCGYKPRCIKCCGPHAKNECVEQIKDIPTCINCKKEGHVGSYKGCEMYPKAKQRNPSKIVNPNISYARIAQSHLNPNNLTVNPETNTPNPTSLPDNSRPFLYSPRIQTTIQKYQHNPSG
ncbi:hypothetical protein AVEN_112808-1 [Araneus ventricosus]|uniref:Pre-C2HC domain-containing protein n=1 Tax=Araneus ventricosus TaxID=182803 RepID=A0A4Y2T8K7_ARAVE|nr:hypothetical protein AVEN_112808-1 [Araneus ventricosus]